MSDDKTPEEILSEIEDAWGSELSGPMKAYMDARLGASSGPAASPEAQAALDTALKRSHESMETELMFAIQDGNHARRDELVKQMKRGPYWPGPNDGHLA